ncbi:hypothetical protein MLD38_018719 [Melastoma candidum]|uniref:Uncharacterized protein n=1 Tax=Melastoma candidum TaxID=119954 RepID=A0ACB9QUR5_9MYRT|nr:hypothetical protein MLD38_018719 [Melastoma candidum]
MYEVTGLGASNFSRDPVLCLSGSVPTQLGSLKELNVVALQYNVLTGATPASLSGLRKLTRLDLSFNLLCGLIPVRLVNVPCSESST